MKKNNFGTFVNVFCLLIAVSLILVPGCKKSEPPSSSPGNTTAQPAETPAAETLSNNIQETQVTVSKAPAEQPKETAAEKPAEQTQTTDVNETSGMVPYKIELPAAMFQGTPQPVQVANLEKPLGTPRPPFLAPPGLENVALGKPVSSSDEEPIIGELSYITDGIKEAPEGNFVELGPLKQYVTIDLGAMHEIWAIIVWHYHLQPRVYYDVIVQVADDPDFIQNVRTLFNNDIDNSSGLGVGKDMHYVETNEGKLIEAKGAKARYVRLYSRGSTSDDLNEYIEVSVYGKPVK